MVQQSLHERSVDGCYGQRLMLNMGAVTVFVVSPIANMLWMVNGNFGLVMGLTIDSRVVYDDISVCFYFLF
jgi:hypothetical protein